MTCEKKLSNLKSFASIKSTNLDWRFLIKCIFFVSISKDHKNEKIPFFEQNMGETKKLLRWEIICQNSYYSFYFKQDSCQSVENCWNGVSCRFEKVSFEKNAFKVSITKNLLGTILRTLRGLFMQYKKILFFENAKVMKPLIQRDFHHVTQFSGQNSTFFFYRMT